MPREDDLMVCLRIPRSCFRGQWFAGWLLLGVVAAESGAQTLHRRDEPGTWCAPVEIRLAAKLQDGSAAKLTAGDLKVWFDGGSASVVSASSFASVDGAGGMTDLLFVRAPYAEFGSPVELAGIVNTLARAEGFRFRAAVLGPDGAVSDYFSELEVLSGRLKDAGSEKHALREMRRWVPAEERAFVGLRHLPGRHVIVRLFNDANPLGFQVKNNFAMDRSLDFFASLDLAMTYRLLSPLDVAYSIPRGDASEEAPMRGEAPDSRAVEQTERLQGASQLQSQVWAQRDYWSRWSAGGAEVSTAELMRDVIRDHAAGYDVVVQPHFACVAGRMRAVYASTSDKDVRLFVPRAVQMIPYKGPWGQ